MRSPLFSLIMPTYNRGYVIWKTIQGVQQQVYPYFELIIIDDGSTDNTAQVVAEFQKDPRIISMKIQHKGGSAARNTGLKKAKGSFITYVDSDDYVYPHFLSTALEYFTKHPTKKFAASNYNRRIELYDTTYKLLDFTEVSSTLKDTVTLKDIFHWNVKGCGTGIFHTREALENGARWDESLEVFQDWDFSMQLGNLFPDGYIHIPFVLFEYLQKYGGDGICSNTTYGEWAKGYEKIWQKHKRDPLMQGQTWYPGRIEKYTKLQALVDAGKEPSSVYKYFPQFAPKK